jgi:hypothetical protein
MRTTTFMLEVLLAKGLGRDEVTDLVVWLAFRALLLRPTAGYRSAFRRQNGRKLRVPSIHT